MSTRPKRRRWGRRGPLRGIPDLEENFLVIVLRASVLRQLGGFDENRDFCFIEDWELWLRVSRFGRVRVLAAPLIDYRLVVNKHRDTRNVTRLKLLIFDKHRELGYIDDDLYEMAAGNLLLDIGKGCLDAADRAAGMAEVKLRKIDGWREGPSEGRGVGRSGTRHYMLDDNALTVFHHSTDTTRAALVVRTHSPGQSQRVQIGNCTDAV